MTERFNAEADQTIYGASGVGPAETPTGLTALGVGLGSGQSADNQERNSYVSFEYPIRWDDVADNLGRLTDKKQLEQLIDDMSVRDRELEDFINTNVVNGIVAGTDITINRASGIVTITAAQQTPAGVLSPFAGSAAPAGWLLAYGQAVSRTTYANLFAAIGTTYGAGDGSTTFNVPDLRGRVIAALDNMGGTDAGRLDWANTLGTNGGAQTVALAAGNIPTHTHAINHDHPLGGSHSHTINISDPGHSHTIDTLSRTKASGTTFNQNVVSFVADETQSTRSATTGISATSSPAEVDLGNFTGTSGDGSPTLAGTAHQNMQPTILLNYIIKT